MGKAAELLQVAEARVAREILKREGVELVAASPRAYIVKLSEVERIVEKRGGKIGPGRPKKAAETAT